MCGSVFAVCSGSTLIRSQPAGWLWPRCRSVWRSGHCGYSTGGTLGQLGRCFGHDPRPASCSCAHNRWGFGWSREASFVVGNCNGARTLCRGPISLSHHGKRWHMASDQHPRRRRRNLVGKNTGGRELLVGVSMTRSTGTFSRRCQSVTKHSCVQKLAHWPLSPLCACPRAG